MNEYLFYNKYLNTKKNHPVLVDDYDKYYDIIVNYYDTSRKKVGKLKDIRESVLFTFIYNISSSCNSLLKNNLIDENNPSDALLIRNVIESILYYRLLFCSDLPDEFYKFFFYHHIIFEYKFIERYHQEYMNENINDENKKEYQAMIERFSEYHNLGQNETEKVIKRRNGWTYGISKPNTLKTKDIAKYCNEGFLENLLNRWNLNSIVHLRSVIFNITHEDMSTFLDYAVEVMEEINQKLENKIQFKTLPQIKTYYFNLIYEEYNGPLYKRIYKKLGLKQQFNKMRDSHDYRSRLLDLFDAKSRFGFECQAYSSGYSGVFETQLKIVHFILYETGKFTNAATYERIPVLLKLFLNMETDFTFGYANEYKIKYRYFIDLLIWAVWDDKIENNFEEALENRLNNLPLDYHTKMLTIALYNESCNFVHPNVYGYIGYYSMNFDYFIEYVVNVNYLLRFGFMEIMKSFPLSVDKYNSIESQYNKLVDERSRKTAEAQKYNATI